MRHLTPFVLPALVCVLGCFASGEGKTVYVGADLWDGTGTPVIHDAVIVVAGGTIEAVGPPGLVDIPRGATEIRLDGKFVMPGLIDAHAHAPRWALDRFISYGVTSVREAGGIMDSVIALRDQIVSGDINGPRLYVSSAVIDGPGSPWPGATIVTTTSEGRRAVADRVLMEVYQIKVHTRLGREVLAAIADEAEVLQTPLAAHLGRTDALTAARLGVSTIEHLSGIVEATSRTPGPVIAAHDDFDRGQIAVARGWAFLDSASLDRTARALAATGVVMVPTVIAHDALAHLGDAAFLEAIDISGVPDSVRSAWRVSEVVARYGLTASDFAAFRQGRARQDLFIRRFVAAGGRVVAGSDGPARQVPPGAGLHAELARLVGAGFTSEDALLAATREAARLFGTDSIGVVRAGGVADFVVLDANPLEDIRNTRRIDRVVVQGVSFDPAAMRRDW